MLIFSELDHMPSELAKGEGWQQIVPELLQQGRPVVTFVYVISVIILSSRADLVSVGSVR